MNGLIIFKSYRDIIFGKILGACQLKQIFPNTRLDAFNDIFDFIRFLEFC